MSAKGDLFPFRKLQRKKILPKKKVDEGGRMRVSPACQTLHCAGTQQAIASMMS